jgi:hypothetical protein
VRGLARTGRLVTSAALTLILILAFVALASGHVIVEDIGEGCALPPSE